MTIDWREPPAAGQPANGSGTLLTGDRARLTRRPGLLDRSTGVTIVLVGMAVAVLAAACRTTPQPRAEALHPDILLVRPEAEDVRYSSVHDGAVSYRLAEPYPAEATIKAIASTIEGAGWRPVNDDLFNPGLTNSHERGWMNYIDGTKGGTEVFVWSADWEAPRGDRVTYALTYTYPKGSGPMSATPLLEVQAFYMSPSTVNLLRRPVPRPPQ